MVSEIWLAIFGRAMRKPRESLGRPGDPQLTNMGIIRVWINLEKAQLEARPQDTDQQRKAEAERKWWNYLFPGEAFPESLDLRHRIIHRNEAFFRSSEGSRRAQPWIAMKALRDGHECLQLCESWSQIQTKLIAHPNYPRQVEGSDFSHMVCYMWFRYLFPGEHFPYRRLPKYWSESFELDFLSKVTPSLQTNIEQVAPRVASTRSSASYVAASGNSTAIGLGQTPNSHRSISQKPISVPHSSNLSPVVLQAESQAKSHTSARIHSSTRLDARRTIQPRNDLRKQVEAQSQSTRRRVSATSQSSDPKPRKKTPWEEEGISADDWTNAFLDSVVSQN